MEVPDSAQPAVANQVFLARKALEFDVFKRPAHILSLGKGPALVLVQTLRRAFVSGLGLESDQIATFGAIEPAMGSKVRVRIDLQFPVFLGHDGTGSEVVA